MRRRNKFLLFKVYKYRDTGAYGELYDFYISRIRRFITFRVPRPEDAEELSSEVFLRGWEYATSSIINNPSALFYKIARNLVADYYRKRKIEMSFDEVEEIADKQEVVEELSNKEEQQALIGKLKSLKSDHRDIIVMRYLDEMSISEIAEALEKTTGNVRVKLHRAKKALKELVK